MKSKAVKLILGRVNKLDTDFSIANVILIVSLLAINSVIITLIFGMPISLPALSAVIAINSLALGWLLLLTLCSSNQFKLDYFSKKNSINLLKNFLPQTIIGKWITGALFFTTSVTGIILFCLQVLPMGLISLHVTLAPEILAFITGIALFTLATCSRLIEKMFIRLLFKEYSDSNIIYDNCENFDNKFYLDDAEKAAKIPKIIAFQLDHSNKNIRYIVHNEQKSDFIKSFTLQPN